jgi:hypothetical protein
MTRRERHQPEAIISGQHLSEFTLAKLLLRLLGKALRPVSPMNRATPKMRSVAKRLMASEAPTNRRSPGKKPPAFDVADRLRSHLIPLMGIGGFRALFSRALALATVEVTWLRAVQVKANGSLEGPEALPAQVGLAEFLEGRIVLLAQLLGLLSAFIGPNLTSRLVGEIWPEIPLDNLDFDSGDQNEKTE